MEIIDSLAGEAVPSFDVGRALLYYSRSWEKKKVDMQISESLKLISSRSVNF